MNSSDLSVITDDIIEIVKNISFVSNVSMQSDRKLMVLETDFLDNRNDMIDISLCVKGNNIYLSDNWLVNSEFVLYFENETILNNIHNQTKNFPINCYFDKDEFFGVNEKQLVCMSEKDYLKKDLLYFIQSILKHLNLIDGYLAVIGD